MTIAIRIAPAMNPGNFPLAASGDDAAAIETTANAATPHRDNPRPRTPPAGPVPRDLQTLAHPAIAHIARR